MSSPLLLHNRVLRGSSGFCKHDVHTWCSRPKNTLPSLLLVVSVPRYMNIIGPLKCKLYARYFSSAILWLAGWSTDVFAYGTGELRRTLMVQVSYEQVRVVNHHGCYKGLSFCYNCHPSLLALSSDSSVSSQLVSRCLLHNATCILLLSRSLWWIGCGRRRLAFTRLRRSSVSTENASARVDREVWRPENAQ